MNFSTSIRSSVMAAGAMLAAALAPTGLQAQGNGSFYTAELMAPAAQDRFVAGGLQWHCEGTICTAQRSGNRPLRVCSDLRREVGTLAAFAAGGEALDTDRLGRCNG